jgi:hypothetical protein
MMIKISSSINHRTASSADSHFLPFTHVPKHDSGNRARQENYFIVAALLCV